MWPVKKSTYLPSIASTPDPSALGQAKAPHSQHPKGAPESPKLGAKVSLTVDTRSGKRLYRKRTVVNVAFTGSIPGIVISTGNAK